MSQLPNAYILKNALWFESEGLRKRDLVIYDGRLLDSAKDSSSYSDEYVRYDMKEKLVTPGLCDVHVHLREPGFEKKETIATGSMAAARGGFTTIYAMPNINPVPDSVETIARELDIIRKDACIEVIPYASITKERKGRELVDFNALKKYTVAFSDDGSGVQDDHIMLSAMREAEKNEVVIAAHCEVNDLLRGGYIHDGVYCKQHGHKGICSESEWQQIARDLKLAEETGCHYHVCHISTKESVDLIRKAKARGVNVTCETGPHYLVFCDEDLKEEGRFKMNPPIRSAEDRAALLEGIQDGTIDCIATDHAPHTADEKSRGLQGSAMGVVGLETSFGVCYTHLVKKGVISLRRLIDLMCHNPRSIFRKTQYLPWDDSFDFALNEACYGLSVFDLEKEWTVDPSEFASMGKATPFEGMTLVGKPVATIFNGNLIYGTLF